MMASNNDLGTVLVVGGCGYLGSNLARLLSSQTTCSAVHVLSRDPTKNLHPSVIYHAGDLTDKETVSKLLSEINPKVIFHTVSPRYFESDKLLRHTNVTGTQVLLECAAQHPSVRAFVYTSTEQVAAPMPGVQMKEEMSEIFTDNSKHMLANPYAKTKAIADTMVLAANSPPTLSTVSLRVPPIYGEDDPVTIQTILTGIKKGQQNIQLGDNKRNFEFVYVENACDAHILAAKALLSEDSKTPQDTKVNGEAFFISDGVSLPYFTFTRKASAFAGHPVAENEIKSVPHWLVWGISVVSEWFYWGFTFGYWVPDLRQRGVEYLYGGSEWDISKARKRLEYKPVDQDMALKKSIEHDMKKFGI